MPETNIIYYINYTTKKGKKSLIKASVSEDVE